MTDLGAVARVRHPVMVEKRAGTMEVGGGKRRKDDESPGWVSGITRPYTFRMTHGSYHSYVCWRCSTLRNFPGGFMPYYRARWRMDRLEVDVVPCRCDCVCAEASREVARQYDAQPGARPWDHWDMLLIRYNALMGMQRYEREQGGGFPIQVRRTLETYDVLQALLVISKLQRSLESHFGVSDLVTWLSTYWDWRTLPEDCPYRDELLSMAQGRENYEQETGQADTERTAGNG